MFWNLLLSLLCLVCVCCQNALTISGAGVLLWRQGSSLMNPSCESRDCPEAPRLGSQVNTTFLQAWLFWYILEVAPLKCSEDRNPRPQCSSCAVDAGCPSHWQLRIKLSSQKVMGLGQTLCSPPSERLKRHGGFHGNQQQMSWVLNATASRNRSTPGHRQPRCPPQVGAIAFSSWPPCSTFLFISQNKVIPAAPLTRTQEGWLPSDLLAWLLCLFGLQMEGEFSHGWRPSASCRPERLRKLKPEKKWESEQSPPSASCCVFSPVRPSSSDLIPPCESSLPVTPPSLWALPPGVLPSCESSVSHPFLWVLPPCDPISPCNLLMAPPSSLVCPPLVYLPTWLTDRIHPALLL